MRAILLLALWILAIHVVAAEMTATADAKNYVTIYETPCVNQKVLALVKEHASRFQRAEMLYEGKPFGACWFASPDGHVYVVDEDGDMSKIPMGAFQAGGPGTRM